MAVASILSVREENNSKGGTHYRHGKPKHTRELAVNYCLEKPERMGTKESAGIHPISLGGGNHRTTWARERIGIKREEVLAVA